MHPRPKQWLLGRRRLRQRHLGQRRLEQPLLRHPLAQLPGQHRRDRPVQPFQTATPPPIHVCGGCRLLKQVLEQQEGDRPNRVALCGGEAGLILSCFTSCGC